MDQNIYFNLENKIKIKNKIIKRLKGILIFQMCNYFHKKNV